MLNVTTAIGAALLAFSALSFLGLGVQPPFYDWGRMLNEGLGRIYVNPAGALAPGAAIVLAGLTFNLLGEGLAQVASGRHVVVAPHARHRAAVPPVAVATVDGRRTISCSTSAACPSSFPSPGGDVHAVRDVALSVRRGEIVGIVGESGSGKTVTALAIAQLVSYPGVVDVRALPLRRSRRPRPPAGRAPAAAGDVVADGVPESGHVAQPGGAGRPPARRGVRGPRLR